MSAGFAIGAEPRPPQAQRTGQAPEQDGIAATPRDGVQHTRKAIPNQAQPGDPDRLHAGIVVRSGYAPAGVA
jgi:hypothetical protein